MNEIDACCAECGVAGGASLKTCKSCMRVRYCNPTCQRNHWPKHKKECKQRAAELHDEALFKDPPPKEDCPICFLPMPVILVCCASLPPATISSLPIYDFAKANAGLEGVATDQFFTCCGKRFCAGCICSFNESGNIGRCPFCNSNLDTERCSKTNEEIVEEIMKRVEANDAGAIYLLGNHYCYGNVGLEQDLEKGKELLNRAAELGSSHAHYYLANELQTGGDFFEEGQVPLRGRSNGWERRGKTFPWNNGGTERKHGTSFEALEDCCISWGISFHV
jgi:hypothetical protein